MENNIYKELFSLVRQEGERLVVIDPENDDGLMVIKLSEYKRLRDGEGIATPHEIKNNEPILAKNTQKNLSFWEHSNEVDEPILVELDRPGNSGRIHERKSAKTEDFIKASQTLKNKDEAKQVVESEETAGEEYYFEPAEEIGL